MTDASRARDEANDRPAVLHLDGWAGRTRTRVTVIGETPKRYRVRFEEETGYGNWLGGRGAIGLVPKYAITFTGSQP